MKAHTDSEGGTPSNQSLLLIIQQLDQAIGFHIAWLKQLHRSLICHSANIAEEDMAEDAHRHCEFGRWFYSKAINQLENSDLVEQIEIKHRQMHEAAREMLLNKDHEQDVCLEDYDRFIDFAIDFKSLVRALQHELINKVCIVDQLTGAWNRHEMQNRIEQEYDKAVRTGKGCSLVMMDIDYFKAVNDQFGHASGDMVLKQLIGLCRQRLRTYDAVFRYGGEEFLFCFPETPTEQAETMIERLRLAIQEHRFIMKDETEIKITASFGIAELSSEKDIENAMLEADHALLCAKSKGRNCICVW